MTRVLRLLAVLGAALIALAVLPTGAGAVTPGRVGATAAPAAEGSDPLAALNSCLVANKAGDVLILLDVSGSVSGNDPTGARIDAAKALLASLAGRIADPESEINGAALSVAIAGFGETVFQGGREVDPADAVWSPLDDATLPAAQQDLESYRSSFPGKETDYWTAMNWAAEAEEAHAAASGTPVADGCHLVFWFTDGAYLIDPRDDEDRWGDTTTKDTPWLPGGVSPAGTQAEADAIRDSGTEDFCRAGGLADRLRSDGLVIAAVGLGADDTQFELMRRIAEDPDGNCGDLPATGVFDRADVTTLLPLIEGLGSSDTQGEISTLPVCQQQACERTHKFRLDSSLRTVHIVGVPSVPGLVVEIRGPGGGNATIEPVAAGATGDPGTAAVDDVQISYQWISDKQLTIDMVRPAETANWTGEWQVTFIDRQGDNPDAVASTRVSLSADLALGAPDAPAEVQIGTDYTLPLRLTSLNGGEPQVGDPAPALASTVVLQPSAPGAAPVEVWTGDAGDLTDAGVVWKGVPSGTPLGAATLRMTLAVTTETGIELDPVVREIPVTVVPAPGTPTVGAAGVDFGALEGLGTASASLPVTGPGCVWVEPASALQAHPAGVTSVAIGGTHTSAGSCLQLTEGQTGSLPLTATPSAEGNGGVRGQVVVHLIPEASAGGGTGAEATQSVPFTLGLTRSASAPVVIGVFVAALVVGIGLPILVLWLTRRLAARYPEDVELSAVRMPVMVGPRSITTHTGGVPTLPSTWGVVPPPTDGRRTLQVEGIRWRARTGPLWSSAPGYSQAVDRPGSGGQAPFTGGPEHLARLPLAVQGTWAVLVRSLDDLASGAEVIAADLLLISAPRADAETRNRLLGDALGQAPGVLGDLRETVRQQRGSGSGPGAGAGAAGEPVPAGVPRAPERELGGPAPTPGWGGPTAAPSPGGWGQPGAPAPAPSPSPGWGSVPPAGPSPQRPADATPPSGTPAAPGWGSVPPPAPTPPAQTPPPQAPGWGDQPQGGGWGDPGPEPGGPTGWGSGR
ncbi:hypothetical protein GIS00_13610 [Nakamurella sp. YIM 132087]|uniref:VWFA domain-containing protein n=1 Tax=Nakamurella alba TaxID=2665158 RepID=A0A7K1FLJ7_9ACTN|nr:hypothetical protein [Nakamurella alba]MTD14976.1 hypothetical protein [Nakamurella alba]